MKGNKMIDQRLKQLRLARGFSLEGLAAAMGGIVSKQALSKYERGVTQPKPLVLNKIATALGVKAAYLYTEPSMQVEFVAYRKGSGLPKKEQARVESLVYQTLDDRMRIQDLIGQASGTNLPIKSYSINSLEKAEDAAEDLRQKWNLGLDPIYSVTDILEENLVHVLEIETGDRFDGISAVAYQDGNVNSAVVVSRRGIPGERQRLNLAHELGHIVLDVHDNVDEEKAAFRFGGAFLAPAKSIKKEAGEHRSFIRGDELLLMKRKFGMSAQALLYRLRDLAIINNSTYKTWCININRMGWRRHEPAEMPPEKPSWLQQSVLRALGEGLISKEDAEPIIGEPLADGDPFSLIEKRTFMKLPLEERRRIMAEQAGKMASYYEDDTEWREFQKGDFSDY